MFVSLRYLIGWILRSWGSRRDLILENLALRVSNSYPYTPGGPAADSLQVTSYSGFFCDGSGRDGKRLLSWSRHEPWSWHRAGFRLYWKWLSRVGQVGGRKPVGKEIRELIFRMGGGEPDVGSTTDSRRAAETGVPGIGAHGLALASPSPEKSRF